MKKKNVIVIAIFIIIVLLVLLFINEIIPIINEDESKNRVFSEMQDKLDDAMRGIVGIIPENNKDELSSHNGLGSGVIFDKKDDTYYVITAKHVINAENSNFKIFTKDTKFSGQTINVDSNVNFEIPDEDYYESLLNCKIEYVSNTHDLAILSFEYDGDLTRLEFEVNQLSINDKIMVIGHPEGDRYKVTYGYIKSDLKTFMNDKVVEHNAHMKQGNSGGVALTEDMKIAGINISGKFSILGHFRAGYMIPYNIVEDEIQKWRNQQ